MKGPKVMNVPLDQDCLCEEIVLWSNSGNGNVWFTLTLPFVYSKTGDKSTWLAYIYESKALTHVHRYVGGPTRNIRSTEEGPRR